MPRRFPAPWTAEEIPGGYKVIDATGQAIAYVYGKENREKADTAKVSRWTKLAGSPATSLSCRRSYKPKRNERACLFAESHAPSNRLPTASTK
jgi:hypothetical protein